MRILYITLVMLLTTGCGNDDAKNDRVLSTGIEEIENPFQGTIRAKQWLQSPIDSAEITYSVRHDQIRREIVSTSVLDKLTGSRCAGVICKPKEDEVVLYCSNSDKKRYCQLTVPEYRALCERQTFANRKSHHGFGHIFLDVSALSEK